jgi:Protein of unknown function (DUF3226)
MSDREKILIVEGNADKDFFEKLLKCLNLQVEVKISTPRDHNLEKNGKKNAQELLEILLKRMVKGDLSHLAMILDSDFKKDGWGFEKTFETTQEILKKAGYNEPEIRYGGMYFPHPDGLNGVGLWVMPDNQAEGMLEDLIKKSIRNEEQPLLDHAITTVKDLPMKKKFKGIHQSKAEIATWMAWQKMPGCSIDYAIEEDLLNFNCELMRQLINWLQCVYMDDFRSSCESPLRTAEIG